MKGFGDHFFGAIQESVGAAIEFAEVRVGFEVEERAGKSHVVAPGWLRLES